jgi:ferrous iron transport protein B
MKFMFNNGGASAGLPHPLESGGQPRRLLLVGNPNVGKSALFNALTGLHATVSNYPGTTVEIARGTLARSERPTEVIDSPGVNSLLPLSEDERVTWTLVSGAGRDPEAVVVQVADAKDLRRALLITLQLGQLGMRTVLSLNMSDEAQALGLRIDTEGLAETLGIPVHSTVATRREGIDALRAALENARVPANHKALPLDIAADVAAILSGEADLPDPEAPPPLVARYHEAMLGHAALLASRFSRQAPADDHARPSPTPLSRRLGRLAVHPAWGWPILLLVLLAVYEVVGVLGAGVLVDLLEDGLFGAFLSPLARAGFRFVPSPFVQDLFVGPYGVVTMGLTYGLAIVLPIVTTFFLVFGVLEDSGYLPRLAVMADRSFRVMGLNGKAVLPMVLGLGCDTMATMTTRILSTRKERVLATLLLALGVPCSAQLGVILAMLGTVPFSAGLVWFGTIAAVMVSVGWLGNRLLPGRRSEFVVELPPMRWPLPVNVLAKTAARVEWYLKEALPLFVVGTLILFALDRLNLLGAIDRAGQPLVTGLLGLPAQASEAFLIGFLRRDYAATRLFAMAREHGLDTVQLVTSMVTITLFVPCIANVFIIAKERGVKTALAMAAFIFPFAFAVGGLVRLTMRGLGFWEVP